MIETGCGRCYWWAAMDEDSRFGLCGHREHGGEITAQHEGENCPQFETPEAGE